jgi:cell division protease FtsH
MTKNLILWLVIAVILMTLFESFNSSDNSGRMEDYTSFVREVQSDQIQEVVFDGKVINGVKKNGERFLTVMPLSDPAIIDSLLSHNVRASGTKPEEQSLLLSIFVSWFPMLLLIGVWIFFSRQMQGGSKGNPLSFGKSKAKLLSENQIKTTFDDVAGCDEAKEDVVELVDFLKDPTKYSKLGGRIPRGVLMVGPPGTGKTRSSIERVSFSSKAMVPITFVKDKSRLLLFGSLNFIEYPTLNLYKTDINQLAHLTYIKSKGSLVKRSFMRRW